jgi:iron complex outermembrane receptor protein
VSSFGLGNTSLSPERLMSFELGYSQELADIIALELNAYYNVVLDQILLTRISRFSLENFPGYSPASATFPVGQVQFENEAADFQQLGGEAGVRFFPVRGLDLYVNYSLHETWPMQQGIDLGGREHDHRTPTHKINGGVQYRSSFGLDVALDTHWVSAQTWVEQVMDEKTGARFEAFHIGDYVLLNARVGYRLFDDQLELGVYGTNLLGRRFRQHPFGQRIDTRLMGTLAVRF